MLLPVLIYVWQAIPFKLVNIGQQLLKHFCTSLVFALAHVTIMVWLRKSIYWLVDSSKKSLNCAYANATRVK
jgi:hypothetical protein